jgi:acyl dehydratase
MDSFEYFEDLEVGQRFETDGRTITESDVRTYVQVCGLYDRLFVDKEYIAEETPFDDWFVPGEMTAGLVLGNAIRTGVFGSAMAMLGFEIEFPNPLHVGDTLYVEFEVLNKREANDPDHGIVTYGYTGRNQDGEVVAELEETVLARRRSADE